MERLEDQIEALHLQNQNFERRHFVPEAALHRLMTEKSIASTLKRLEIEKYYIPRLVKDIMGQAWKVFAILLVIRKGEAILTMFKHDSLQNSSLDGKLPYTIDTLEKIFKQSSGKMTAAKFFKEQWDFAIPYFSRSILPRDLENDIILPIMDQKFIGKGSFGMVWGIDIHSDSHMLGKSTHKVLDGSSPTTRVITGDCSSFRRCLIRMKTKTTKPISTS
jgi:hypothetical protein